MANIFKTPGAPTERPPTTASKKGKGCPCAFNNKDSSARAGAVSRPSKACMRRVGPTPWLCNKKAPPPMPLDCGSTKPKTICTAIAASTADPPACNMSRPAWEANGLALATAVLWVITSVLRFIELAISGCNGEVAATVGVASIAGLYALFSEGCQLTQPATRTTSKKAWAITHVRKW